MPPVQDDAGPLDLVGLVAEELHYIVEVTKELV